MMFLVPVLCGVSSAVLAAIVLGFAGGGLSSQTAAASLGIGSAMAAFLFWRQRKEAVSVRGLNLWECSAVLIFTLFALRAFLWLIFREGDTVKVLSPNNLGDLSLHLTYIHQLANGAPFWPENPILAGARLTYPLGVDLFNALLVLVGIDTLRGLIWVGLVGSLLTGLALWRWGGAFAVMGFLCAGGLTGFMAFKTGQVADYQAEFAWKSLPLALFVTQRGLLYAIPAGLVLLCSWRARFFPAADRKPPLPMWVEVLLYASLPVFHLHTFLVLSILLLAWFIVNIPARGALLRLVAAAFLPASALVFLVTGHLSGPALLGWAPGWMQRDPDYLAYCAETLGITSPWLSTPLFWLLNFGFLPFFVIALVARIATAPEHRWARAAVFPAIGIFLLCCFVRFAPWEWDNTKLMCWSYVIVLPFLWQHLIRHWSMPWRVAACFALFWSGFISLLGGLDTTHRGYVIVHRSEVDELAGPLRAFAPEARFVAQPTYNHPLLLLGRPLLLGYTGHVWSHGYPWKEPLARVESILRGEEGWRERALEAGARYLFWGSREAEAFPESPQPWLQELPLVASGSWGAIYDLQPGGPTPQRLGPKISLAP